VATPATTAMQTRAVAPFESSKLSAVAGAEAAQAADADAPPPAAAPNATPRPASVILRVRLLKTKRA